MIYCDVLHPDMITWGKSEKPKVGEGSRRLDKNVDRGELCGRGDEVTRHTMCCGFCTTTLHNHTSSHLMEKRSPHAQSTFSKQTSR